MQLTANIHLCYFVSGVAKHYIHKIIQPSGWELSFATLIVNILFHVFDFIYDWA